VAHLDDKKAKALHGALKAMREDPAAFKDNPKGKVPDLEDDAVAVFQGMEPNQVAQLLEVDEQMEKAGFSIASSGFSVRMV